MYDVNRYYTNIMSSALDHKGGKERNVVLFY